VTSEFGIKQADLGRLPADLLARLLLRDLVADSKGTLPADSRSPAYVISCLGPTWGEIHDDTDRCHR
jgi:hypothetical protein